MTQKLLPMIFYVCTGCRCSFKLIMPFDWHGPMNCPICGCTVKKTEQ